MKRLSIIVPLTGNLKRLEETLVSVLQYQPEKSEIVVVLNQPYDDPYELRGEVKFVEAAAGADLVDCFACGLAACSAPIVHVMASGFEATPGWADAALARFDDPSVAAVAPVVVDRGSSSYKKGGPDRVLSAGLSYSSGGRIGRIGAGKRLDASFPSWLKGAANARLLCGPELAVAFYRRHVLEMVETIQNSGSQDAAAVDLALSIQKAGYCSVQESGCVATATPDMPASGGAWREGLASERIFRRWPAVPGGKRSWAAHAALVAMECLQIPLRPSILARLAGRCWAMVAPLLNIKNGGSPPAVALGPGPSEGASVSLLEGRRPRHIGSADARPALRSRAAG